MQAQRDKQNESNAADAKLDNTLNRFLDFIHLFYKNSDREVIQLQM